MAGKILYSEKISSYKTEFLFLLLTALFAMLAVWGVNATSPDIFTIMFFILFCIFLFYSVNYRALYILLTHESLKLKFGIFTWTVPLRNIETCSLDEIPMLMKMGGAGIHFMTIQKRYRASFNFLEYPRVVLALKKKTGLVRDISFSTRQPNEVLRLIQEAISEN